MYRLLLIIGLLVVLYFLIRSVIRGLSSQGRERMIGDPRQMVQDPVCRAFVPKGSAVAEEVGGQTYYFCSQDCAQTFRKQLAG
jgi:YHS domain-containing protein